MYVLVQFVYYSPGGNFFTPFFVKITTKMILDPGFSNILSETLQIYTFLVTVFIVNNTVNNVKALENKIMLCNIWFASTR